MRRNNTDLLAIVERSPQAAGRHDRAGWVGLFTADGRIEDPVGSRPHRGHREIGRFYDTFIGPRRITFHRDMDIVVGSTVIRDLDLEVGMGPGVTLTVPMYLRYVVAESGAELEIAELQAYWDLPSMVGQFLKHGLTAVPAGLRLSAALATNQGMGGAAGFLRGFRRVGRRQRAVLAQLSTAVAGRDEITTRRLLYGAVVQAGDGAALSLDELGAQLRGAVWTKPIGAGRSVAVGLDTASGRGVLIADFGRRTAIDRLRLYAQ